MKNTPLDQLILVLPYLEQLRDDEKKSSAPTYKEGVVSKLVNETRSIIDEAEKSAVCHTTKREEYRAVMIEAGAKSAALAKEHPPHAMPEEYYVELGKFQRARTLFHQQLDLISAALSSAAPDLLAVVEHGLRTFDEHPPNPNDDGRQCICSQCEFVRSARAVVARATGKEVA
ncbi:hypothetical protein JIN85_14770 [Luteolibacter pohnpeiensis]|uniref:Uncharacterized protein n=1 Tax=Luteolibacter pohnpeiensis TaxID=454153 RepID=A0A934S8C5_9BACT|nr:hypothetical protein [Luteolibacter pohnpeiensis]MBK1883678.1 hypothetical protein [Luteolibacter pohnpeiensis]